MHSYCDPSDKIESQRVFVRLHDMIAAVQPGAA
jgi:hypothetical protein